MDKGIIVGTDQNQEWLLEWWWKHYSKHNDYPVAFCDFGMSESALEWCQQRGQVIAVEKQAETDPVHGELWELLFGKEVWDLRAAWFQKPFALLKAPFTASLWIDLDCKITGPLSPLFASLDDDTEIALVRDIEEASLFSPQGAISYNAGVIAFKKELPFFAKYAALAATERKNFLGDQDILALALSLYKPKLKELPPHYNWVRKWGPSPGALIEHYTGQGGKLTIKSQLPESL